MRGLLQLALHLQQLVADAAESLGAGRVLGLLALLHFARQQGEELVGHGPAASHGDGVDQGFIVLIGNDVVEENGRRYPVGLLGVAVQGMEGHLLFLQLPADLRLRHQLGLQVEQAVDLVGVAHLAGGLDLRPQNGEERLVDLPSAILQQKVLHVGRGCGQRAQQLDLLLLAGQHLRRHAFGAPDLLHEALHG